MISFLEKMSQINGIENYFYAVHFSSLIVLIASLGLNILVDGWGILGKISKAISIISVALLLLTPLAHIWFFLLF